MQLSYAAISSPALLVCCFLPLPCLTPLARHPSCAPHPPGPRPYYYPQPCFTLTADRFKALQKRGLVEPRKPAGRKLGRKVEYVTGERQEKAREAQQEIEDLKKARKKAAKAGTAEAAQAVVAMAGGKGAKRKRQQQARKAAAQVQQPQLAPGSILPLEVGAADEAW